MNRKFYLAASLLVILLLLFFFRWQLVERAQLFFLHSAVPEASSGYHPSKPFSGHQLFRLTGKDKFFPHRVNSIRRFNFLYEDFRGFECDVHFDEKKNALIVAHDYRAGDYPVLNDLLERDKQKKIFWLDVKNLSEENAEGFGKLLDQLDQRYQLKNRIVIESAKVELLDQLFSKGYLTSWYVPDLSQNMNASVVDSFCKSGKPQLLSHDVLSPLPATCGNRPVLQWDLSFGTTFDKEKLRHFAGDSNILVCLLNIKSPGYR